MRKASARPQRARAKSGASTRDSRATSRATAHKPGLALPHERDESAERPERPRPKLEQAAQDLERGLRDTERRGTPSDVPVRRNRRK